MSQYIVAVEGTDAMGQVVLSSRTVVYADTELEARTSGSRQLNVEPNAVTVRILGDTGLAAGSQVIGKV